MHGPPLIGWLVAAIGLAAGVSCLLRTAPRSGCAGASGDAGGARAEGVMGLGMGLMAVPGSGLDQRPWGAAAFTLLFGVAALRSVFLARRAPHHVHHAVGAAAMVYMAVAMAGAPRSMADMDHGPVGTPSVTGLLLCYFAGYAIWTGARTIPGPRPVPTAAGTAGGGTTAVLRAPELATACRVSMAMAMVAMLVTM